MALYFYKVELTDEELEMVLDALAILAREQPLNQVDERIKARIEQAIEEAGY